MFLLVAACDAPLEVGARCTEDVQCRMGADCFKGRCTRVCSPKEPCPNGLDCVGYRCLTPEPKSSGPDPVAAELRAIRVELEAIRRQQEQLLERLE